VVKLDLGCGTNKREGFIGVDSRKFEGVDQVVDLKSDLWPWEDSSVEEAHCSHMIEHLTASERIHFVNELYRVLAPAGKCTIIAPHWNSCRAYGDLTHQWPPVSEFWFYYLSKEWRKVNAPHNDEYTCDFSATWGYSVRQDLVTRNQEFQMFALNNYKEAAQDLIATIVKVKDA
jgi:ubiquinone/menaquinone biosynthesis C-methylase UbiE